MMAAATSYLLRGPLLMATVLAALLLPYLLQLPIETLVCLALFVLGIVISLQDAVVLAETSVRRRTAAFLDNLVLGDVLKSWFDPETGWVAFWASFFIGNATMYTLPMTDNQRIRLVQSCLWTSNEEARTILTAPGGFKVLLPDKLQLWLYDGNAVDEDGNTADKSVENECDQSNLTEETETSEAETKEAGDDLDVEDKYAASTSDTRRRGLQTERKNEAATNRPPQSIVRNPPPCSSHPQYPLDAMGSILKEITTDFMKRTCASIPDSTMQGLAVAASAAFALQMYKSPRSRRIVTSAVEGTTALTFASVAVGAIAALVTKSHVLEGSSVAVQQSSFLRNMLAKVKQAGGLRRVQGMIAVLVLWCVGRRRRTRELPLYPNSHLRR